MQYNKEQNKNILTIKINLENKDLQSAFDRAILTLGPSVSIKGFRPGKAPVNLVITQIGETKLSQEVLTNALDDSYREIIEKEKFEPIDYPKVEVEKYTLDTKNPKSINGQLSYKIELEILPAVKLGDLAKIKLPKSNPVKVSEKEIDDVITYLSRQRAKFQSVAREAKLSDRVEVNYSGSIEDQKQDELSSKNHPIILGDKTMIKGFEEELVGLKVGQTKKFSLTYPEDSPKKHLVGKKIDFEVEVLLVEEILVPEIDQKFVESFGHKSLIELRKAIESNIKSEKEHEAHHQADEELISQLLKISTVEISETLISKELERMLEEMKAQLDQYKIKYEDYLAQIKKTEQELKDSWNENAKKRVATSLAVRALIKKFDINESDEDAGHKALHKLAEMAQK